MENKRRSIGKVIAVAALLAVLTLIPMVSMAASVPRAQLPVVITSCGQSPDALMIKLLCDQIKLANSFEKTLLPTQLKGFKTLIIGIGGSVKGLGEAGIDTDDEIARINRVIEEARRQKMLIVAMHTGGQPRRGDLADPFIHAAAPNADFLVVRNDGNKDGVFMKIAAKGNIPIVYIEQTMEVKSLLSEMFQ